MISINLIKQASHVRPPKAEQKRRGGRPSKALFMAIGIGTICILSGGIGYLSLFSKKKIEKVETVEAIDDYKPSSLLESKPVEDIVKDTTGVKEPLNTISGMLDVPYEELTFLEKINYEVSFAKNVFDLFTKTAITGVDFKSIELVDFTTVKGQGISDSKEKIGNLFTNFRLHNATLLPKPYTEIGSFNHGYEFNLACNTEFGLNLQAPFFLGNADIMSVEELDGTIDKMRDIVTSNSLVLSEDFKNVQTVIKGNFRQFHYSVILSGSYRNLILCINNLYERKIPCAFEYLKVSAQSTQLIAIDGKVVLTTTYQ